MVSGRRAWAAGPGAEQEPSTAAPHAGGWQPTGCYSAVDGGAVLLSIGHLHPKRNMQRARMVKWRAWAASDKEIHVLPRVLRGERAQRHILQATTLNKNCFTQPRVSQQHKGAQPISSTCTAALPAPKPSPARVLLAALQDTGLMLLHPKLSPTSTSHPTINIVQALSSDLKDVVHTGADIAETTVASCMECLWSGPAPHCKQNECFVLHFTAPQLHFTTQG